MSESTQRSEGDSEPSDVLVLTVESDEEDEFVDAEDGTAGTGPARGVPEVKEDRGGETTDSRANETGDTRTVEAADQGLR